MKWSGVSDRRVVDAVIRAFCDSAEQCCEGLSQIDERAWTSSYYWLDASGMALYFLEQIETMSIESALPAATLQRLRQNRDDNRRRSAAMFAEFAAINEQFQAAGVAYCNLKGFTLIPDSCPDAALRCQLDFDFLVDPDHLTACREILAGAGYMLVAAKKDVWEFTTGSSVPTKIEDHYKPRPQRSVELHFDPVVAAGHPSARDERLDRSQLRSWKGVTFPVLSSADQFAGQALHLLGHLRSPSTRTAWLLEFKRHVSVRKDDHDFWREVAERSWSSPPARLAIGIATALSFQIFGGQPPAALQAWAVDHLPAPIRLWADSYGRQALLADFPGTKLHLLLEREMPRDDSPWQKKRFMFVPSLRATRIIFPKPEDKAWQRMRAELYQIRFILFRMRFHLVHTLLYLREVPRWKRRLRMLRQPQLRRDSIIPSAEQSL